MLICKNPGVSDQQYILYSNFGIIKEGDWYYQTFGDHIKKDIRDIYKDSLKIAVEEWETEFKLSREYGSGKTAYQYLICALKKDNFSVTGINYILPKYIKSKMNLGIYMQHMSTEIPQISIASNCYSTIRDICRQIQGSFLNRPAHDILLNNDSLINMIIEMADLEEKAIDDIKKYLSEYLFNRNINPYRLRNY